VRDGLVWVGTNNDAMRDPSIKGDGSVLLCFRASDGRFLWQHHSPKLKDVPGRWDWGGAPLRSMPLIEGDRLWFVTNRWEVLCLDVGPLRRGEGGPRELWKTDLIKSAGTWPTVMGMGGGLTCSIRASWEGKIYLSTGNGLNHKEHRIERPEAPALVCLDQNTGRVLAVEDAGISRATVEANWSSPVLAPGKEHPVLLFAGGDGFLHAFDPRPARDPGRPAAILKELWKVDCRRPKDEPVGMIGSPAVAQGKAYAVLGVDSDTNGPGRLVCVDVASGRVLWDAEDFNLSCSTPVVRDGLLFAVEFEGFVNCFDAETGVRLWRHDTLSTILASPLLVDGKLYVVDGDGEVLMFDVGVPARRDKPPFVKRASPEAQPAPPAVVDGTIYLTTSKHLVAIREQGEGAALPSTSALKRGRSPGALYVPTPKDVVRRMLELAQVKDADVVYDLGSGDGRIVLSAASDFKARGVGVEIDLDLVESSQRSIHDAGVETRACIIHEDLLKVELAPATVITLYVGKRLNDLLLPKLEGLKPGVRVVSHEFPLPGVKADRVVTMPSAEDEREHSLYLYTTPLTR
jgi:outer membrane protein assembly factor BamB